LGGKGMEDTSGVIADSSETDEDINSSKDLMIEEDPQIEDLKVEDLKVEDPKIEGLKVEDLKVEDPQIEDSKEEDPKIEDSKVEDLKEEDPKIEDSKVEDSKEEDSKLEGINLDENKFKIIEVKVNELDNTKPDDISCEARKEEDIIKKEVNDINRIMKEDGIEADIGNNVNSTKEHKNNVEKNPKFETIIHIALFPVIIIYLESIFHLLTFRSLDRYYFLTVLSSIPIGITLGLLTGVFKTKINIILSWIFTSILCLVFCVQLVYRYVFKAFLSLYSVGAVGTDVLEFKNEIFRAIFHNLFGSILLLLPLPLLGILLHKKVKLKIENLKCKISLFGCIIITQVFLVLIIPIYGKESYAPYDLYHNTWVQEMGIQKFGLLTATRFDVRDLIFDGNGNSLDSSLVIQTVNTSDYLVPTKRPSQDETTPGINNNSNSVNPVDKSSDLITQSPNVKPTISPTNSQAPTEVPIDTSPNILDINFKMLAENEKDNNLKVMHEYFASITPTNKNKYTGMFKGYNLILITAEGFSPYAVNELVTPTLYKLTHEGFVFENFYTPLWWASTSDGEYVACNGLIPKPGVLSFYESGSNSMPFALGNQFNKIGYNTKAYHNHTYTYYKRNISHPNMGYLYKGIGNGLDIKKSWPESDLEMMDVTIPEYINEQPFHTYYMTVSGHMNYTFMGNSMSTKNKEAVKDLPYSMEAKAYIACNIELDKALEKLIQELEKKGIADKTVIALSADHYPYGLEKEKIDELAGHEVEENFEIYKNHFILWSGSMKEPVVIDKACSSLDILPTISNLFGLPYDSRLFMGQDILSDAKPLVIFSNRSFIDDKVKFNSETKDVTKLTDEVLPDDYIYSMNQIVKNKFLISKSILENDYYHCLFPDAVSLGALAEADK
jgi:lipoteichoic acid synthase